MNKMKKMLQGIMLVAVLAIVGTGCGAKAAAPVAIDEAVDKCEVCNMMVKNDHNATEIILKNGKALKFDDIGDMYVWTKKNGLDNVDVQFVRDYKSSEWIQLKDASFAYDASFKTPMAYGVYSFKDSKEAEAYISEHKVGKLLTVKDLDSHSWERSKGMMDMHSDDKSDSHTHTDSTKDEHSDVKK